MNATDHHNGSGRQVAGSRMALGVPCLALLVLMSTLATPNPAAAQTLIAAAKTNLLFHGTNTFFPATGTYWTVKGRVTSPFLSFTNNTVIYLQDSSAGVRLYGYGIYCDLETNNAIFAPGVEVTLTGYLDQDRGMRSIRPEFYNGNPYDPAGDFFISNPTPAPVTPAEVLLANYLAHGEDWEANLIKVTNVLVTSSQTTWPLGVDYALTTVADAAGTPCYLYINKASSAPGQLVPTNRFDLTGIAFQMTTALIPSNGYYIMPRAYSDLDTHLGPQPPRIYVPTNRAAQVGRPYTLEFIGQDRNPTNVLTLGVDWLPAGATFAQPGERLGRVEWTPPVEFQGVTTNIRLWVSDGTWTATQIVAISVGATYLPGYAWINEFHYDDVGEDNYEGVELAGAAGIDLDNYTIYAYNGGDGKYYLTKPCAGMIEDAGGGYGAVWFAMTNLQNGPADGFALVSSNRLLDFFTYEGTMTASNGPAIGRISYDCGVVEDSSTPDDYDCQMAGTGTTFEAFFWIGPTENTRGEINAPHQELGTGLFARVTFESLQSNPEAPTTNDPIYLECMVIPSASAELGSIQAWYRINDGGFEAVPMVYWGENFYATEGPLPAQTNGAVVEYYIEAEYSGPGAQSPAMSYTNATPVVSLPDGSKNVGGYWVRQSEAGKDDLLLRLADDTLIAPSNYIIVARNATRGEFQTYWKTNLNPYTVYINTGDGMPVINGGEYYTLLDYAQVPIDGPSPSSFNPSTKCIRRISATNDATLTNSWIVSAMANASPGSGCGGNGRDNFVISEISDAANSKYEFVELFYDSRGIVPSNRPPFITLDPLGGWYQIQESNYFSLGVTANAAAGDIGQPVALVASNVPAGANWSNVSGPAPISSVFSWRPSAMDVGTNVVKFHAANAYGTALHLVTVVVYSISAFLPAPEVRAATSVESNRFVANWREVDSATGYILDVASNAAFRSGTGGGDVWTNKLAAGDLVVVTVNADVPKGFDMIPMVNLLAGTQIALTDNAWSNTTFVGNEGIVTYTAPEAIPAGRMLSYRIDAGSIGFVKTGSFDLSGSGDTLLAYQGDKATPSFLYGVGWAINGPWISSGSPGNNKSYIPAALSVAGRTILDLGNKDNYQYRTTAGVTGAKTTLLARVAMSYNWETNDAAAFPAFPTNFTLPATGTFTTNDYVAGYKGLVVDTISQVVTGLFKGTRYFYRVKATNSTHVSVYSSTTNIVAGEAPPSPYYYTNWAVAHGLNPASNPDDAPSANRDGDPDSNYEEFCADTDPLNAAKYFRNEITNYTGRGTLLLHAGPPTTNSRLYDVWMTTNLVRGIWQGYGFDKWGADNGAAVPFSVTNAIPRAYYRTGVKVPEP